MRSLLMASAALIMSGGFAVAQTTTAAPAPTSAPSAAASTSGSPGNMAPKNAPSAIAPSSDTAAPGADSTAAAAPAPTGAPNAAPAASGASPGNLAPAKSASAATPQPSASTNQASGAPSTDQTAANSRPEPAPRPQHHAMGMQMASLPANASAGTYLHIAKIAIRHHQVARADDALSHAETRLLTRSVPADSGSLADASPAVTAIEHARSALGAGNYAQAASDTDTAHGDIGGMSNASDMSTP